MKFVKNIDREIQTYVSIVKDASGKFYKITDGEKELGIGYCTLEESLKIRANDFSPIEYILKEHNIKNDEFNAWAVADNTLRDPENCIFKFGIDKFNREPINELPYGVFTITRNPQTGAAIIVPHFKEKSTGVKIIRNRNLKDIVKDFFENPIPGRKNKMGLLLYGPPGNGKTTEILELMDQCEELKLRVFLVDSEANLGIIESCREALNGQRNCFVFEEMTERLRGLGGLESLLTFLDGEKSWDNTINIATTNYPEDFPANLVDRPGRFERFIEYGNPTKDDIMLLADKFEIPREEAEALVGQSLSFDYVSYMMGLSKKLGTNLKETRKNEEEKRSRLSSTFKGKMGF